MRALWLWVLALVLADLPLPKDVYIPVDGRYADVTMPRADDVRRWAEVLGEPIRVHAHVNAEEPPQRLTTTEFTIEFGPVTSVRVHHLLVEQLDTLLEVAP